MSGTRARRALGFAVALASMAGCVQVYGPGAGPGSRGHAGAATQAGEGGAADLAGRFVIANRKYDEAWDKVGRFYADHRFAARVSDREAGLVAAAYADYPNAGNFVACADLRQTSNVTYTLKVVTRLDDAGQGVAVALDVTGSARVESAGRLKASRVACRSNGALEQALAEALRK
ncbi:hypothetical protein Bsp3421_004966 [Burkholderia sp. FERM BP-3421]|uniref:hypothetical protein n=1 Tax=Burkholderia sp. FERM BP-3421 TaxID=1494466 RepID=UPI00235F9C2A|nr:hypothetical protein [Burkholderia sp. FERM BP-3421]WDD94821.1 hypothetical protein Bsp3421_004966 [Burkholderia sp. FERM BP-3421]